MGHCPGSDSEIGGLYRGGKRSRSWANDCSLPGKGLEIRHEIACCRSKRKINYRDFGRAHYWSVRRSEIVVPQHILPMLLSCISWEVEHWTDRVHTMSQKLPQPISVFAKGIKRIDTVARNSSIWIVGPRCMDSRNSIEQFLVTVDVAVTRLHLAGMTGSLLSDLSLALTGQRLVRRGRNYQLVHSEFMLKDILARH